MPLSLLNHSALALFAQRTRIPTSARSIGFCAIWVCISSSSIYKPWVPSTLMYIDEYQSDHWIHFAVGFDLWQPKPYFGSEKCWASAHGLKPYVPSLAGFSAQFVFAQTHSREVRHMKTTSLLCSASTTYLRSTWPMMLVTTFACAVSVR